MYSFKATSPNDFVILHKPENEPWWTPVESSAGLWRTFAAARRAGYPQQTSSASSQSPNLPSRSAAQVFFPLPLRATECPAFHACMYVCMCLSCRWQRLWERQHFVQLQWDIHQLLWHQTLTYCHSQLHTWNSMSAHLQTPLASSDPTTNQSSS